MKKQILAILLCFSLLVLCGCNTKPTKYKRISYESEALGERKNYLTEETIVVNQATNTFETQIPIYEISPRGIPEKEYEQMLDNLGLKDQRYFEYEMSGSYLFINLVSRVDHDRGFFEMTEEAGEKLAWELFNKIPFMEGEYECAGMRDKYILSDNEGSHITRAGFVFCRVLNGIRVVGDETCTLFLDGSGLVAISIKLFDYENIGTMDMVTLADASTRLKTPDAFDIGTASSQPVKKTVKTLQAEQVSLRLVNQYSGGCDILQPVYYFTGTATYEDGYETSFSSKIIAIPESMTYEEE
jgi:hypothetical protein